MTFESDLEKLRDAAAQTPSRKMRIRHERRMSPDMSAANMLSSKNPLDDQVVALYDVDATKGAKPVVVVHVDPSADLTVVEQGSVVTVRGWPIVGRAAMVEIDGTLVAPVYPCTSPVFRTMRFR
jgi:hypothetical protein